MFLARIAKSVQKVRPVGMREVRLTREGLTFSLAKVQTQVRPLVRLQHAMLRDTNKTEKISTCTVTVGLAIIADLSHHDFSTSCYSVSQIVVRQVSDQVRPRYQTESRTYEQPNMTFILSPNKHKNIQAELDTSERKFSRELNENKITARTTLVSDQNTQKHRTKYDQKRKLGSYRT
jgi:hypothetical protein